MQPHATSLSTLGRRRSMWLAFECLGMESAYLAIPFVTLESAYLAIPFVFRLLSAWEWKAPI